MITKDMIISEIIEVKPQAITVLMGLGMGCMGCPSATMENLEQACEIHGLDVEEVLKELNSL